MKEDIKKLLHNLAECDVKAVPCSKAELFNMLHTHYHPISGNRFHFDDLLESNWDSRIMPYREDTDLEESFTDELIDEMLYGGLQMVISYDVQLVHLRFVGRDIIDRAYLV